MASSKISVIIDVAVDQANRGLKSFRQSITDADGAAGKFKAGTSSAFDAVKANAGALALGAGTALVSFGVKAVGAFQETALEAGKLRDSLGLTAEEASRMMEVSGDLGIGLGALETSLGKMNLAAARTPGEFEKIGASISKNLDGTTNVQQTFLNAVDAINRIPDATDRANAASRIFGKGWREISELIGRGSDELKRNLEDVAGSKVIDDSDVNDAREFRDTLDELGDVGSDALVGIGGELVPVLSLISQAIVKTLEWKDKLAELTGGSDDSFFSSIPGQVKWFVTNIKEGRSPLEAFGGATDDAESSLGAFEARMYTMQGASRDLDKQLGSSADGYTEFAQGMIRESKRVADELTADWDRITGKISDEQAWLSVTDQIGALEGAWLEAMQQGEGGYSGFRQQQLDAQLAVAEYIQEVGGIPPEKATAILALIDQGKFAEAQTALNVLTTPLSVRVKPYLDMSALAGTQFRGVGTSGYTTGPGRAAGGPVSPGTMYPVGEGGRPELYEQNGVQYLIPGDRGQVTPASGVQSGGGGLTVHIHAGIMPDKIQLGRLLRDAQAAYERAGGR